VLSLFTSIYTLITLLALTLALPVRLLLHCRSFAATATSLLYPPLRWQHRLIYSTYPDPSDKVALPMLTLVHVTSPLISLGLALAAWVVACFWCLSAMVAETEKGGDDGKETADLLLFWWEMWLVRSFG
jgi:hypothetical protein